MIRVFDVVTGKEGYSYGICWTLPKVLSSYYQLIRQYFLEYRYFRIVGFAINDTYQWNAIVNEAQVQMAEVGRMLSQIPNVVGVSEDRYIVLEIPKGRCTVRDMFEALQQSGLEVCYDSNCANTVLFDSANSVNLHLLLSDREYEEIVISHEDYSFCKVDVCYDYLVVNPAIERSQIIVTSPVPLRFAGIVSNILGRMNESHKLLLDSTSEVEEMGSVMWNGIELSKHSLDILVQNHIFDLQDWRKKWKVCYSLLSRSSIAALAGVIKDEEEEEH